MPEQEKKTAPDVLLREKLIGFQRQIAELKRINRELEEAADQREQELFLGLFEVLDAFDNLEQNIRGREEELGKSGQRVVKSTRAVQRKLLRMLRSRHVEPLEFSQSMAQMERCKIIATKNDPGRKNEEIISVEKKGYIDTEQKRILRKAEVVTVYNDAPPMISACSSLDRENS